MNYVLTMLNIRYYIWSNTTQTARMATIFQLCTRCVSGSRIILNVIDTEHLCDFDMTRRDSYI